MNHEYIGIPTHGKPKDGRQSSSEAIKFVGVPYDTLRTILDQNPTITQSELVRSAIIHFSSRLNQMEPGLEDYLNRVAGGMTMKRVGFRVDGHSLVEKTIGELGSRYPMRGQAKGRFGVYTLVGYLVELWAGEMKTNGAMDEPTLAIRSGAIPMELPLPIQPASQDPVEVPKNVLEPPTEKITRGCATQIAATISTLHDHQVPLYRFWHPQAAPEAISLDDQNQPSTPTPDYIKEHFTFIMTVGCSGSGKTNWVESALANYHPTVVSADAYTIDLDGQYYWSHETNVAAHAICKRAFSEAITRGDRLIVIDSENLVHIHRQHYLDWARKHQYQGILVVFDVPAEVGAARNIHGATLPGVTRQRLRLDLKPGVYYVPVKRLPVSSLLKPIDAVPS